MEYSCNFRKSLKELTNCPITNNYTFNCLHFDYFIILQYLLFNIISKIVNCKKLPVIDSNFHLVQYNPQLYSNMLDFSLLCWRATCCAIMHHVLLPGITDYFHSSFMFMDFISGTSTHSWKLYKIHIRKTG